MGFTDWRRIAHFSRALRSGLRRDLDSDGRRAVSVSGDGTLKVWNLETGCELRTIDRRSTDLLILTDFVAVTPDGKCAISSSSDRTLKVWELDTGIELRTLGATPIQSMEWQ